MAQVQICVRESVMAGFIQAAKEMTERRIDLLLRMQIFHDSQTNDRDAALKKITERPY